MTLQMDLVEAWAARDEAVRRVALNAPQDWKDAALKAVFEIANTWESFTTDDVVDFLERVEAPQTHELRALGAIMQSAQREGWISPTDRFRATKRKSRHAAPVRIWRSLIAGEIS